MLVVGSGRGIEAVGAVLVMCVAVVGARDQGDPSGKGRDRLAEPEVLLERPVARGGDHNHARRPQELERHLSSPVQRELRTLRVVAAIRDAQDRQGRLEQGRGERAVGLPLPHPAGRDHGEVILDVDRVRGHDDRNIRCGSRAPASELVHCGAQARVKVHVAVRRDAGEDEAHGSEAIRETSNSRKRSASTSTPTSAFGSRPVTPRRSTTLRPSQ